MNKSQLLKVVEEIESEIVYRQEKIKELKVEINELEVIRENLKKLANGKAKD